MKPITALAVLAALLGADAAAAMTAGAAHHRPPARAARARLHKASRTAHRRRPRIQATTAAVRSTAPAAASPHLYRASEDDAGAPDSPGWFKSAKDREAGWGFNHGGTQTVVGFYQRPPQPDIPGPQTYHTPEGRGAAGLSLSFKLGQ